MPEVVERTREKLDAAEPAGHCACVGGDFFVSVPSDGDTYILASVIHDYAWLHSEHAVNH